MSTHTLKRNSFESSAKLLSVQHTRNSLERFIARWKKIRFYEHSLSYANFHSHSNFIYTGNARKVSGSMCLVHFVLSNNLASFIWLQWLEASPCCFCNASDWCGIHEKCRKLPPNANDKVRSIHFGFACDDAAAVATAALPHSRNVFIQFAASSIYVCDEAKASAVEFKIKKVVREWEWKNDQQPRMCKLHELQTMQL